MILAHLSGGLGNQLFQYAAARTLAERRETSVVQDLSWFARTPRNDTQREYKLDRFGISAMPASRVVQAFCYAQTLPVARRLSRFLSPWRTYDERTFRFDPRVLDLPDETHLIGYWQSYRYFDEISKIIRRELTPTAVVGQLPDNFIPASDSVSVHVRRGDYVARHQVTAVHGICPLDYYERATAYVANALGKQPDFFVFSDDPDWVEANLKLPGPMHVVRQHGAESDIADLRLMSLCQHHVIANSSFSWWAAWLNARSEKLVIAPKRWFVADIDTKDLLPPNWIQI